MRWNDQSSHNHSTYRHTKAVGIFERPTYILDGFLLNHCSYLCGHLQSRVHLLTNFPFRFYSGARDIFVLNFVGHNQTTIFFFIKPSQDLFAHCVTCCHTTENCIRPMKLRCFAHEKFCGTVRDAHLTLPCSLLHSQDCTGIGFSNTIIITQ